MNDEMNLPRFMVRVDTLPTKGFAVSLDPDEAERGAIARHAGILAVDQLHCELKLSRWRRDGVRIEGTLIAEITQACAVTLDPLENSIREEIKATFLPENSGLVRPATGEVSELVLDPEGEDPPEIFSGNAIDVWAVVLEAFLLAIDPFARSSTAILPEEAVDEDEDEKKSPFAALEQLKTGKK